MTGEGVANPIGNPAQERDVRSADWWSIERLLYGAALALGVWLRLWSLGAQPLSPWEASNSWPAWLVANGSRVVDAPTPVSALYFGLQWLLFWTGVNSDSGARFFSVAAGATLIVTLWWWRGFLGRRAAVIAAILIAIDPWLLGFSRLADGASLALTVALLALVALSQVVRQPQAQAWKRALAIAAGLLIVAGPMGWNLLPVVMWWGWLLRQELAEAELWQRQWLLWCAIAALAGATFGLARLDGLAWVASGMSIWLSQVDGKSAGPLLPMITGGYGLWWPWLRLWVDAALLLPFGVAGLILLAVRARKQESVSHAPRLALPFFVGWLLWGIVLWLLPGRSPLALPVLGLPLLFLSAMALDTLIAKVPVDIEWREAGAVIATLLILLVSGMFWLAALLATKTYDPVFAQAAMVIFGLALAILVAFGFWANRRDAAWVASALLATLLLLVYIRSSWRLNYGSVVSEPAGWQALLAHPEVRLLAGDMETLSSHRSGDPYQVPVQVQVASYVTNDDQVVPARPDPVVGWELRNMKNLTWVESPQVAKDANPLPLVVTPVTGGEEGPQLDLPDNYAGSHYHVDSWWLPSLLTQEAPPDPVNDKGNLARVWAEAVQPWWRWFIYREAAVAPQNRDVILWAPVDTSGN